MRKFLIFALFPAAFVGDSIIMPVVFNSRDSSLTIVLILAWLLSRGLNNKSLLGFVLFFALEIFWGVHLGTFILPFALVLFLFLIASKFFNIGYTGFMQYNLIARITALSLFNIGLFYAFNLFSLWTGNIFYNSAGFNVSLSLFFSWGKTIYVFALTVFYLLAFNFRHV